MKNSKIIAIIALLGLSCSSTRFVDSWKSEESSSFVPEKLLVVGMTDNLTARRIFEASLKREFQGRGVNALESSEVLESSFTSSKRSEEEIEAMKESVLADGFDSVIITAVIGVDDRTDYRPGYYDVGYRWYRFGRYYYRFQEVYYTPGYYDDYKVYHVETSLYNLKEDEATSLVWVGTFEIVNPRDISGTVENYVSRIMQQLERDQLVSPLP